MTKVKLTSRLDDSYIIIEMDIEKDVLVVDPYVVNMLDIKIAKIKNVLRIRRPGWGKGNLSNFIKKVSPEDLKKIRGKE